MNDCCVHLRKFQQLPLKDDGKCEGLNWIQVFQTLLALYSC